MFGRKKKIKEVKSEGIVFDIIELIIEIAAEILDAFT